jgi:copper(I)-binding protein
MDMSADATPASGDGMKMDGPLSAAYMVIENSGGADRLLGASGDVAAMVQVHQTKESNGMMVMEQAKDGVDVPANGSLELKPGSYHIMLMNVKDQLKPGDTFKLTLKFSSGAEIPVDVTVREP